MTRHSEITVGYERERISDWDIGYISERIREFKKAYKCNYKLGNDIQNEILIFFPITSGCSFVKWLNYRLYSWLLLQDEYVGEDTPNMISWEDIGLTIDSEDESDNEEEEL